jgi:hypothetical protein
MLVSLARSTLGALQPSSFGMLFCLRWQGTKAGDKDSKKSYFYQ